MKKAGMLLISLGFVLTVTHPLFSQPSNDHCADAYPLPVGTGCDMDTFSSVGATAEPQTVAPNPSCGFYHGGDVWFTALMPSSGALRIEYQGISGINPQVAVYSGTCGSMTQLVCLQLDNNKTIIYPDLAGQHVYIRVYNYNSASGGTFRICVWEPPVPPNNNCGDAIELSVGSNCNPQTFTNAYASGEPASVAPNPTCGFYQGGDVWFKSTMPASGNLRIEVSGIQAAVYVGTCGSFTQVTCLQLDADRTIINPSIAGQPIYVRAFSYSSDDGGPFTICLWEPPVPPNNDCADAIWLEVGGSCTLQTFTNAYADAEPASVAPNPTCGFYHGGDVWFRFVMPASGALRIECSTQGAVYRGSCGNFTQYTCMQLDPERTLSDTSIAGDTLYLRAFTYSNEEGGPFTVCLWECPVPPNDNCINAIPLTVSNNCASLPFTNRYATTESGVAPNPSCGFYNGGDVWFTAVVPNTGKMIIHRNNIAGVNAQWAVYSGVCGAMTQIACAQLIATMTIDNLSLAGSTVYIRVYNYSNPEGGEFALCVYDTTCNGVGTFLYYDTICSGGDYLFPDGTLLTHITESLTDSSIVQNELHCDSLIITHLFVKPLLPPPSLPEQAAYPCESFSLLLDAGEGYDSYTWNTGHTNRQITVTQPGTYIVSVTGCVGGPASDTCTVTLPQPSLSGKVTYFNTVSTPLPGVTVYLKTTANAILDSCLTDGQGNYRFCSLANGDYRLGVSSGQTWGGVNSIDGLLVLQHYTELIHLAGLKLAAADVNLSGYVNSTDALLVQKRFVELIDSFAAGDWLFETPQVSIDGMAPVIVGLKGICTGDVNGSYIPE